MTWDRYYLLIEYPAVKVKVLEKRVYLLSSLKDICSIKQIETSAVIVVNNYVLDLLWGFNSIYLFDSHNKEENCHLSSSITVVL